MATLEQVASSDISVNKKETFFKKQLWSGKQRAFRATKKLKKAIQTPTKGLGDVKTYATKVNKAKGELVDGLNQVKFARRELAMLKMKKKKFWKS